MSIFYEQELVHKAKVDRRKTRQKEIVKVRYNCGGKYKAMVVTIPNFVINKMGLKHGDLVKITMSDDSIIIKPFIGETVK